MPSCKLCSRNAYYGLSTPQYCRQHKEPGMKNVVSRLCEASGCQSTSHVFGFPGQKGVRCKKHAIDGMINVINKLCEHVGCQSTSIVFDVPGGKGRFCKEHALSTMINVRSCLCEFEGCSSRSRNFDIAGGKGRFCKIHKKDGMLDVRNALCKHEGCSKRSNFSFKGIPPQFCSEHKLPGMCNRKSCEYEGCTKYPGYNFSTETSARFCASHKHDGMVYLRNKVCRHSGCKKTASFGTTTPQYCRTHASSEMRNLITKYCEHAECELHASYNHPGQPVKFCLAHSEVGMVIVNRKGCEFPQCKSHSRHYDHPGGKGRFCTKHKEVDMVDVINPKCDTMNCASLAVYGIPGGKKTKCTKHRTPGMLSRPRAKCVACRKPAFYGKSFIPKYCEFHKENDDENLIERDCISCGLTMVLDKNNKCEYCEPIRFQTNRLAKQNALMEYLDRKGLRGNSTDIVIDNGSCGKERPDRVFDFGDKIVIVECDEHQHRERQCECEQTRMVNISQSYGGVPVYFIRWNPDNYVSYDTRLPEIVARRHLTLAKYLHEIEMNRIELPHGLLCVCYMYYDGWNGVENMEWTAILKFES